jgi:phthalate 4,5-cis-dihydrodiol dehydrogenase
MIDFEGGVVANVIYSGYDHFDSDEFHGWVSTSGFPKSPRHGASRHALQATGGGLAELRLREEKYGYGSGRSVGIPAYQPHFGQLIVTYEHADIRTSTQGLTIYDNSGVREISIDPARSGRVCVLDELSAAILDGQPPIHDGAFARATLQTSLAILRSSRERREIRLQQ